MEEERERERGARVGEADGGGKGGRDWRKAARRESGRVGRKEVERDREQSEFEGVMLLCSCSPLTTMPQKRMATTPDTLRASARKKAAHGNVKDSATSM
jgi:hypothetical protein